VSLYMGMRQTSDLDQPEQFHHHVENAWDVIAHVSIDTEMVLAVAFDTTIIEIALLALD
jgi:hypothetical protein